LTQSQRGI